MPINKILLINPPIQDFYQTEIRQQPLGLKYIQAVLENEGYETCLLDSLAHHKKPTIPIPPHFNYLKAYYPPNDLSPFKLFSHYRHFGLSFPELSREIQNSHPDLIGISVNFTPYFDMALATARLCTSIFPNVPIVAGGHHATAAPERVLQSGPFDFVILGEGEQRILQLIRSISDNDFSLIKKIDGIAYREHDRVIITPITSYIDDLDHLPILNIKNDPALLITSRGCPKNCNFCSIAKVMGKKVRFRSIEAVIQEIETGIKNGVRKFDFEDDHLTINQDRARQLLNEIITRFGHYGLTLSAMNGLMADTLDDELIQLMKLAGFEWLNIPLVSGSPEIQNKIDRNQSDRHFLNVVAWAQTYGLKIVAYLILGLPEDRPDQMIDDVIFLAGLPVLIGPSLFYPPPGSATFNNCIDRGYISGTDYALYRSSAVPLETENFSRQDLITVFRIVRAINFVKGLIDKYFTGDQYLTRFLQSPGRESDSLTFHRKLTPEEIGILLIDQLFQHRRLRGLRLKKQSGDEFEYDWIDYKITPDLVTRFVTKIDKKTIAGIAKPFQMILSN